MLQLIQGYLGEIKAMLRAVEREEHPTRQELADIVREVKVLNGIFDHWIMVRGLVLQSGGHPPPRSLEGVLAWQFGKDWMRNPRKAEAVTEKIRGEMLKLNKKMEKVRARISQDR